MPQNVYPGMECIVTIDTDKGDGTLEEFEVTVPDGCGPGSWLLVDLPTGR